MVSMEAFKTAGLSEHCKRELKRTFTLIDKNKDGRICANDMKNAMSMLGYPVGEQQISGFIRRAAKGGCDLREDEFIVWMESSPGSNNSVIKQAFEVIDTNKDGFISKDELREGFNVLGEIVSESMLDLMMEEADLDNDDKLNFEEFQHAITLRL